MVGYVALVRGVNVGGKNLVSMASLREAVAALGHGNVRTYIQSGNVMFTAADAVDPSALETVIAERCGVVTSVVVRSGEELRAVLDGNPFALADRSHLHVGFMSSPPGPGFAAGIDAAAFLPEEFAVRGRDLYLHLPAGAGRAKLPAVVGRRLGQPATVRNWATVTKLAELAC